MHIYNQLLAAFAELCQAGSYTSIVKRAWQLYQAEAVQKINVYAGHMINGIVKDIELHAVVIDSEHIRYSSCTCQQPQFCEHIGALFLQYCKTLENGKVLAEQAYFQMLGVVKASLPKQPGESEQPAINQQTDAAELFRKLNEQYGDDWKKCKHSFHPLSQTLTSMKSMAKSSEYELQRLHWCASIVFVLYLGERALQAADSFSRYYHEMSFKRIAEPWTVQLYEWLEQLQAKPLQQFEQRWIRQLLSFVYARVEMYEKPLLEWDYIYYRILSIVAGHHALQSEMKQELEFRLAHEHKPHIVHVIYGSLAVLAFQAGEDEQALAYLENCQFEKIQRLMYPMVESRMQSQHWDKVEMWMDRLQQQFASGSQLRSVGPFLALCRKASALQPEQSRWLEAMLALLPHSYQALTEHYYAHGRFEAWADLQMYMGRRPEELKGSDLQKIERQAPAALLPIYHQAIEFAIHTRNRQGYRTAAKHMKKLQALYEQLEQPHVWQSYFERMQDRYNRLRAFQEELSKGKLVE
ncbi:hypothetical protein J40TS1_11210 [Paenibacillus montaniterrae]|uniref:SWIM-type domain-containing protein n=1 Tax=Paenibacillus montaniterrae TaxID=429341 RepID=A0A919YNR8_9BACL|nr:hypothetical protein [Paenibacillus montaniterrae]GIP15479.1 hypothetical protein J40TS1_11210 [Paenibacillus montaniterrae]